MLATVLSEKNRKYLCSSSVSKNELVGCRNNLIDRSSHASQGIGCNLGTWDARCERNRSVLTIFTSFSLPWQEGQGEEDPTDDEDEDEDADPILEYTSILGSSKVVPVWKFQESLDFVSLRNRKGSEGGVGS
jgi:hypothetical protein